MRDVCWCLLATLGARRVNGDAVSREFGNVLFFRGIDNLVGSAKELQAGEEIKVGQVCFAPPHVAYVSRRERFDVEPSLGTSQNLTKKDKVLRVTSLDELQKHLAQELGSKREGTLHSVDV